jgi:peroxiredoxin
MRIVGLVLSVMACIVASVEASALRDEMSELSSRAQSMAHGYYAASEWERLLGDLDVLALQAENEQDWDVLLEARLLKATIFSELLKDPDRGLKVVQQTREKFKNVRVASMPRLYVREAEILAQKGDETGIARLIEEFKRSPYFDQEQYGYKGGWGREVPLAVTRPSAKGNDSLTVTAMEVARQRARAHAGRMFPDGEFCDVRGRVVRMADLRGKVVLVDFWSPQWTPWREDLRNLIYLRKTYGPYGFEIIGIPQGLALAEAEEYARQQGMTWMQAVCDKDLPRRLGVYGDVVNFLVDRNGVIVARNLRGANLVRSVKTVLELE